MTAVAGKPHYVRVRFDERDPPFDQDAVQFNLKRLLERSEMPDYDYRLDKVENREQASKRKFGLRFPFPMEIPWKKEALSARRAEIVKELLFVGGSHRPSILESRLDRWSRLRVTSHGKRGFEDTNRPLPKVLR